MCIRDSGIITSPCGSRINPILSTEEFHNGIDIAAEEGSNVYAVRSGYVTDVHVSDTYGNVISFNTDDGYTITYNHLQKVFPKIGEKIIQGEVIALSLIHISSPKPSEDNYPHTCRTLYTSLY